jgi:hypothetical protein
VSTPVVSAELTLGQSHAVEAEVTATHEVDLVIGRSHDAVVELEPTYTCELQVEAC